MCKMDNPVNPPAPKRMVPLVIAAFFATLLVGGGYYALRGSLANHCFEEQQDGPSSTQADKDYLKWEKPLVALVVSGQMHGYINPCGCSHPQNGGLERRYNFIQSLKDRGWDVVGLDLGELPAENGIHAQNLLKYQLTVKALRAMNYRAIGIGKNEFSLPLGDAMAQIWDKNHPLPRPLNMTLDRNGDPDYGSLNVRAFEIIGDTNPKIGVINMFGPDLSDELKGKDKFLKNTAELPKALDAFAKAGVEFGVILHHEYPKLDPDDFPPGGIKAMKKIDEIRHEQAEKAIKFCEDARKKNAKIPRFYAAMLLLTDPEPPLAMAPLNQFLPAHAIEIGHKGKYVGLVGVYRDKNGGYRMQYQKVLMSPEWETPEAKKAKQPIITLMEKYQAEVKSADMLAKSPRYPHFNQVAKGLKATYVGSKRCGDCHETAHDVWEKSKHAVAMETLEHIKSPGNRHFDPECVKCHTTGFQHPGGYNDFVPNPANWPAPPKQAPAPAQIAKHNKNLRGVGCETCHGPGSEHVQNTRDATLYKLINPYKPTPVERQLEDAIVKNPGDKKSLDAWMKLSGPRRRAIESNMCLKCHDQENDVHWGKEGKDIVARWLLDPKHRLIHHTTPNNNGQVQNKVAPKDGPVAIEPPPLTIELPPPPEKK
jgi:hypothetical protein